MVKTINHRKLKWRHPWIQTKFISLLLVEQEYS